VERRFILFLVLTVLLWAGFLAARFYFFPPQPEPVAELPADPGAGEAPAEKDKGAEPTIDKPPVTEGPPAEVKPPGEPAVPKTASPRKRVTLGSLASKGPYLMLVTFDSQGAAVERIELKSDEQNHYYSIDDGSGYLGHLALTDAGSGGAEVNVVGSGTPASLAKTTSGGKPGLMPGDVITEINGKAVSDAAFFEDYLAKGTRPGDAVKLKVTRAGAAQPIDFVVQLTRRPLEVVRPESHRWEDEDGVLLPREDDPLSLLVSLENVGGRAVRGGETEIPGLPALSQVTWEIDDQGPDWVQFSYPLSETDLKAINKTGSWKIVKRYQLAQQAKPGDMAYHLDLKIELHNLGDSGQQIAYRFDGPTGLPTEGWWYSTKLHPEWFKGAGARDIAYCQDDIGHSLLGNPMIVSKCKDLIGDGKSPEITLIKGDQDAAFKYVGVDTQFFAAMILPKPLADGQPIRFRRAEARPVQDLMSTPPKRRKMLNSSVRLVTPPMNVEPNKPLIHEYRVFFGPKKADVLGLGHSDVLGYYELEPLIEYGLSIFKYPALLLQGVLGLLYSITRNYGIAIILLTVIVRSCMVPISLKQARAAAKMQELAPEIQKIKDKHPDDPMKQHTAVQELYKKHKFNPFGGCLLVFIQLPIFIGLYRCLSVDIDLRDASLIPGVAWATNLAGPDALFYWKPFLWEMLADETGWFGPYFNVLPIFTVVLFLIQQKMFTPPATDEQTQMQQKMMMYMTVFMGVMFYKVPAGLCLYFIVSSLWGIGERKLLAWLKPKPAATRGGDGGSDVPAKLPAKPASPNGSSKPPSKKQKQRR
jgi:YidC/Oxa1 family membrane protein insertase